MAVDYSFPQADNLEFVYQVFTELTEEGLDRYSFGEKYAISDRQGAYYLNALCFIKLANKVGKTTYLSERGSLIQKLDEPFRKKVFQLSVLDNRFLSDTYQLCKGKSVPEQKEICEILLEGTYGISDETTRVRRARTMVSWYKWLERQTYFIEEKYNG